MITLLYHLVQHLYYIMPKKKRGSGIGRHSRGRGDRKASTTSNLHHPSSNPPVNPSITPGTTPPPASTLPHPQIEKAARRNHDLQRSLERSTTKNTKLAQQLDATVSNNKVLQHKLSSASKQATSIALDCNKKIRERDAACLQRERESHANVDRARQEAYTMQQELELTRADARELRDQFEVHLSSRVKEAQRRSAAAVDKLKLKGTARFRAGKNVGAAKSSQQLAAKEDMVASLKGEVATLRQTKDAEKAAADTLITQEKTKWQERSRAERTYMKEQKEKERKKRLQQEASEQAYRKEQMEKERTRRLQQEASEQACRKEQKEKERTRRLQQEAEDLKHAQKLQEVVVAAKSASREFKEFAMRAQSRMDDIREERDCLLRHMTQMEMDAVLTESKLNAALNSAQLPAFVFRKETIKDSRARRWPMHIIQLILELLVAGVPPSSVNASIVAFVKVTAPHIKILLEELPSIWFIRRCRTVLLTLCTLLAAHRLASAKKWGAFHSDGTGRRHLDIIDLTITIEEAVNEYVPILFSASILPEDGTAESQHDAILTFIEEKKRWLQRWMQVLTRDYPDYEHNINPDGLTLAKLGDGGNSMTDGCNTARKFNGMMCDTIKRVTLEHWAAAEQGTYVPNNDFFRIRSCIQ